MIQAAKYLQVPPWELAQRPAWWTNVALESMAAESAAQKKKAKRRERSNAHGGPTQR